MKKILSLVLTIALTVALTACTNAGSTGQTEPSGASASMPNTQQGTTESESQQKSESADTQEETETGILVAYFSRTGENYDVGYIEKDNTHIIADIIAEQTGGDTFEIRTVTPYPDDYDECTDIAKQEQSENARPELEKSLDNLDDYDVIFIGYPIWWGDIPMAVYTFLEIYDFTGKTIVPFCTHAGSGLAGTEENMQSILRSSAFKTGFSIQGTTAQNDQANAQKQVSEWLRSIL